MTCFSTQRLLFFSSSAFLALSAVTSADTCYWVGANTSHTIFTDNSWLGGTAPSSSRAGTELHFDESRGGSNLQEDYNLEGGEILASEIYLNRSETNGFYNGTVSLDGEFKNAGLGHVYSSSVRLNGDSLFWAEKGDITLLGGLSLNHRNVELRTGFMPMN